MNLLAATLLVSLGTVFAVGEAGSSYVDDYREPTREHRRALRGEWKIGEGLARCTQDDATFKKNKDHGPVIWYDLDFTDAVIEFAYEPRDVQAFVFTVNGERGHIFRFSTKAGSTTFGVWPQEESKPAGDPMARSTPLGRDGPPLKQGQWTQVRVEFRGEQVNVKIGDYAAKFTHPALAQKKTTVGLAFAHGSITIKPFSLTPTGSEKK